MREQDGPVFSRVFARARRRRVARDLERRMAELDRLDRQYGLGTMPSTPTPRARRTHGPVLPGLLVAAAVLAGVVVLSPDENSLALRRRLGLDDERLATAPQVPQGLGSYAFLKTQRGSDEPVAYDPCRPIEVLVNPDGAPANYRQLVETGLERTAAATGLTFVRAGNTRDRSVVTRGYPRRRPVLIAWATPEEVPELAGDVAGIGGSVAVGAPGRLRFVTGSVMLDRDLYASFGPRDTALAQAIVDHELAHLVGLGHVDDPGELMHADNLGRTSYGPGDREGLARLGSVPC